MDCMTLFIKKGPRRRAQGISLKLGTSKVPEPGLTESRHQDISISGWLYAHKSERSGWTQGISQCSGLVAGTEVHRIPNGVMTNHTPLIADGSDHSPSSTESHLLVLNDAYSRVGQPQD
jgi:hypothetical protein